MGANCHPPCNSDKGGPQKIVAVPDFMKETYPAIPGRIIEDKIFLIRAQRVMIDRDLAQLYGVETKYLNRQVKRNILRFPPEFMFRLNRKEKDELVTICHRFLTMKHSSSLPFAFTEYGAIMAATVLNSPHAVQMSIFVVRAFVKMRQLLLTQTALARRLVVLEKTLTRHLASNEVAMVDTLREIIRLLTPVSAPDPHEKPKKRIGFTAREKRIKYAALSPK